VITMCEAVSAVYWLAAVLYSAEPIAVPQLPDVGAYWAANHNKPTVELLKSGEVACSLPSAETPIPRLHQENASTVHEAVAIGNAPGGIDHTRINGIRGVVEYHHHVVFRSGWSVA